MLAVTHASVSSCSPVAAGPDVSEYLAALNDDVKVPEVRTRVHPEKLQGVGVFWKILQEAQNKDVVERARDFLNRLYTQLSGELRGDEGKVRGAFIETYLNKLAAIVDAPQGPQRTIMLDRMIGLMIDMIDESERRGTGGVRSHNAILKGEKIDFVVHNKVTQGKNIPQRMDIQTNSNATIWELKVELGRLIDCSAECMKLTVDRRELRDTDHGKTVGEFLAQKRAGVLLVERTNMDDVPRAPLVESDQSTLTEPAKRAFASIFLKFAKNGKMDSEGAAEMIRNTTGEKNVGETDSRIKTMMKSYDTDHDGTIDLDGFLEFYRDSIVNKREDTVRKNLQVHGFRNDLKRFDEVEVVPVDAATLPRYILSCNPKSFELLFRALDTGGSSTNRVWDLVGRLTTNETMYRSLLLLDNNAKQPDWPKLISTTSVFRLLYSLQILNSFLESSEAGAEWQRIFIERGGFGYLLGVFLNDDPAKGPVLSPVAQSPFEKECISLLCGVLGTFVRSAACRLAPELGTDIASAQAARRKKHRSSTLETAAPEENEEECNVISALINAATAAVSGETSISANANDKQPEEKKDTVDLKALFRAKKSKVVWLKNGEETEEVGAGAKSSLEQKQAECVIDSSTRTEVWTRLLRMISAVVFPEEPKEEFGSVKIVRSCSEFLCDCILARNSIFPMITAHADKASDTFEKMVIAGLFNPRSQLIRQEFTEMLNFICYMLRDKRMDVAPLSYVLRILLQNIPKQLEGKELICGEYFELTCRLVDLYYRRHDKAAATAEDIVKPKDLLSQLVRMVKEHKLVEVRNSINEDHLLIGLMNTIRKVAVHTSYPKATLALDDGLLQELFSSCLFPASCMLTSAQRPITDTQKCKSKTSRAAAYKLLATLCKGSLPVHMCLMKDYMEPLCQAIKPHPGWAYVPAMESRSKLGYVGIENLGCICYMISMIQQFYMIPSFRYGLLGADDKMPPTNTKPDEVDDNVLHQMQKIFAFLELSERQSYNLGPFCFSFKDFDGNPTNTSVQQDAQEFLNVVFDRLEGLMRCTPERYLVRGVFCGKTCSQFICKGGCGSIRRSYEDFYNLSVGVKGFRTLAESLNKYISGDTISDFYCENCQKKVDVVKRTCLHQLPNVLIIHLQRLIYNFDTQTNEKVNSRLEFPREFSIEPYTVEGLEARESSAKSDDPFHGKGEEYYHYKLTGVVVHIGTADTGHYYSYINTNRKRTNLLTHPCRSRTE